MDGYVCWGCGAIFDLDAVEDMDDVHCPECDGNDIGHTDDVEAE